MRQKQIRPLASYLKAPIFTIIAGVASSNSSNVRQQALHDLKDLLEQDQADSIYRKVSLIPEPTNKYDSDAIQAVINTVNYGRLHIGYISNSFSYCDICEKELNRYPANGKCPECTSEGSIVRFGLATELSLAMRTYPGLSFSAVITGITGGTEDKKSYGCNIKVIGTMDLG